MNSIHEECGVFGIYSTADDDLAALTYYGLYALQHRGQESAGIALNDDGVFRCIKGPPRGATPRRISSRS